MSVPNNTQGAKGVEQLKAVGPAKFCPHCGKRLSERSKFCPQCGKPAPDRARRAAVAVEEGDQPGAHPERPRTVTTRRTADRAVRAMDDAARRLTAEPAPAALPATFEQAGFGLRYGAWMFDFLITLIAMMTFTFILTAVSRRSVVGSNQDLLIVAGLTFLLFVLNFVVFAGRYGQSAGMRILGIRILRVDARPFTMKDALMRHLLGYPLSTAVFFLGFLWMLWDPRQQAWHDKLARTIVVMSR